MTLRGSSHQRDTHCEQPDGPGDVEDRDRGSCQTPSPLLVGAEELCRADEQSGADDDPGPPEPDWQRRSIADDGDADQHGPDAGEEVAEVFADPDPEVLVQGPENGSVDLELLRPEVGSAYARASAGTT